LFSFIPPKPEGVEKETAQNSVLCVEGKALSFHPFHLFLHGLMDGTCLEEEDSATSIIFQIDRLIFLGNQNMPHQLGA